MEQKIESKKPNMQDSYRGANEAVVVIMTDADGKETKINLDRK